jgi:hypothetical protein
VASGCNPTANARVNFLLPNRVLPPHYVDRG